MRCYERMELLGLGKLVPARIGERSSEKAGVGGSIPSLATIESTTYRHSKNQFHSVSFQKLWSAETRISDGTWLRIVLKCSRFRLLRRSLYRGRQRRTHALGAAASKQASRAGTPITGCTYPR